MGFDKEKRPFMARWYRHGWVRTSTAASTALSVGGVVALETTSTGAPVVYTLARPPLLGEQMSFHAKAVASSSDAPFHINAGTGVAFGTSSEDMLTLPIEGDGALLQAVSSDRWAVVGTRGGTMSTST